MGRGARRATVHGIARVGQDLATKPPPPPSVPKQLWLAHSRAQTQRTTRPLHSRLWAQKCGEKLGPRALASASQCHVGGAGPPVLRADGIPQDFTASGQGQVGTSQPEAFAEVLGSTLSAILCAGGSPKWQSGLPFISNIYLLAPLAELRYVYTKSRARCIMRYSLTSLGQRGPGPSSWVGWRLWVRAVGTP